MSDINVRLLGMYSDTSANKIIRSGITFVSRNVFISAAGIARPFMFAALC